MDTPLPPDEVRSLDPQKPIPSDNAHGAAPARAYSLRFHLPHAHLTNVFGGDWFALRAEAFARFFGTPTFLIGQTAIVFVWIVLNVTGRAHFDLYPFILLNLAFSLQAAYAAPLILLAQTRQADRDKANNDADAIHRETLARENSDRQREIATQGGRILELIEQNTRLTEATRELTVEIRRMSEEMHRKLECERAK